MKLSFALASILTLAASTSASSAKKHTKALRQDQTKNKVPKTKHLRHIPIQSRIVGGFPSDTNAFPYFTTTADHNEALCGASLIHQDIVMTAAHCVGAFDSGVRINIHDLENPNEDRITRSVVQQVPHPQYDDWTTANDIMILKLDQPVTTVQPIQWETSTAAPSAGETLTVMGFGTTSSGGDISTVLQQVDVQAVPDSTCTAQYGSEVELDVMFCAGVTGGGKDSCQGDSGGPIIDQHGTQVGIVSWGEGCALATHSGVYTRVGHFSDWIEAQICELSDNPPASCGGNGAGSGETGGGTGESPSESSTTVDIRMEIFFDGYAYETSWTLTQKTINGESSDVTVFTGPDFEPADYQDWELYTTLAAGRSFEFTLEDSFGDGFDGSFAIFAIDGSGAETLLVDGPSEAFEFTYTTAFTTPSDSTNGGGQPPECADATEKFFFEQGYSGTCDSLVENGPFRYLCGYADVAFACSITCDICEEQKAVVEDNCASDSAGVVDMGDVVGEHTCQWLKDSMSGSSRFDGICERAGAALHCAATCNTCTKMERGIRGIRGIF